MEVCERSPAERATPSHTSSRGRWPRRPKPESAATWSLQDGSSSDARPGRRRRPRWTGDRRLAGVDGVRRTHRPACRAAGPRVPGSAGKRRRRRCRRRLTRPTAVGTAVSVGGRFRYSATLSWSPSTRCHCHSPIRSVARLPERCGCCSRGSGFETASQNATSTGGRCPEQHGVTVVKNAADVDAANQRRRSCTSSCTQHIRIKKIALQFAK